MPVLLPLTAANARRVPWRNGRGVTDELFLRPEGASFAAGDFDLRISRATVPESGPFSSFPGFDRVLVVTGGEGLSLSHAGAAPIALRPLEPHAFSGDDRTEATLLHGPVSDFNVIVRRGRCRAQVEVARAGAANPRVVLAAGDAFVHAVCGTLEATVASDARPRRLAAGDSLFVGDVADGEALALAGDDAIAIVVRLPR